MAQVSVENVSKSFGSLTAAPWIRLRWGTEVCVWGGPAGLCGVLCAHMRRHSCSRCLSVSRPVCGAGRRER